MTERASARRILGTVVAGVIATAVFLACSDRDQSARPSDRDQSARPDDEDAQMEAHPPGILDPPWLDSARQAQLASAGKLRVFHDFKFSDRIRESGIRFRHKIVADAGKYFKPVHYDHGNGIAVADVDGDGLYDIYFLTQVGSNQLWRNLGDGKFEDITEDAGVAVADGISVAASFADIDNDGDPDLYVTTVRAGNALFENDGSGRFRDISKRSGLDHRGHSSGAVFFDYNRDGLLDLFLTNVGRYTHDSLTTMTSDIAGEPEYGEYSYYVGIEDAFEGHLKPELAERSVLFKNMGDNRFGDVSEEVGLVDVSWSGDASPLDANDDGWPDLYVPNMQGNNHYYENVRGERFVDKSRDVFPRTPPGAMGIKVFDYNNDGRMDIYITDMHSDMSVPIETGASSAVPRRPGRNRSKSEEKLKFRVSDSVSIFGNAFYEKEGGGRYREISDQIGAENLWPWGLSVGDLNADGYEDVFITSSMNFLFDYAVNSVLLNNQGEGFFDSEFILGVEPRRGRRTAKPWFEVDCSGKDREHRGCRDRSGRWVMWAALGSRSSVIFDLDNDGDLDIVTNDFNSEPMVLISDLSEKKKTFHFLNIELIGTTSNRSGLGATVTVHVGSETYTKVRDGKSGYLSQSLYPLYFGLGDSEAVDRIEVHWPSGQQQVVSGPINVDTLIEVTEQ